MSVTTDAIDVIRSEVEAAGETLDTDQRVEHLVWAVGALNNLVEKLHARILFLEQQQQRAENY